MILDFQHDANAWVAVSFVLFAALVWFKGRKAILAMLDGKIATIRQEIATAESLRAEAQKLLKEYEHKHKAALSESEKILATARHQAEAIRVQADADLEKTVQVRERQLAERLERMKQNALEEIQRYAADLAIQATRDIIREQLDQSSKDKLIDQSIRDLDKNFH